MDDIAPVTSVTAANSQVTIESLQMQMERYSNLASQELSRAGADYRALQAALATGNVSDAQTALARLELDDASTDPTDITPSTPETNLSANSPPAPSAGDSLDTTV
jgi:hypothetical protein